MKSTAVDGENGGLTARSALNSEMGFREGLA